MYIPHLIIKKTSNALGKKHKKAVLSHIAPHDASVLETYRIRPTIMSMERLCMLNAATLSTRTHLASKPAQNTLNHV